MEKWLANLDAWAWRYIGNPADYSGCHFTATRSACDALLRCLDVLAAEGDGSSRTVGLKRLDPQDEAKIYAGHRYTCFRKMRIRLFKATAELQQMCIHREQLVLVCDFTTSWLHRLREGIEDVRDGNGDYSIEPHEDKSRPLIPGSRDAQSECLWFWPCFGHASVDNK